MVRRTIETMGRVCKARNRAEINPFAGFSGPYAAIARLAIWRHSWAQARQATTHSSMPPIRSQSVAHSSQTLAHKSHCIRWLGEPINIRAADGDPDCFYQQQLLLARLYSLYTELPTQHTAEGSVVLHRVLRALDRGLRLVEA